MCHNLDRAGADRIKYIISLVRPSVRPSVRLFVCLPPQMAIGTYPYSKSTLCGKEELRKKEGFGIIVSFNVPTLVQLYFPQTQHQIVRSFLCVARLK